MTSFSMHYTLKPLLKQMPTYLRNSAILRNYSQNYRVTPLLFGISLVASLFFPVGLSFYLWQLENFNKKDENEFDVKINSTCGDTALRYHYVSFLCSSAIGLTSGAFLGQLFEMRFVKLNLSNFIWQKTQPIKTLLRIILTLILSCLFLSPYFIISFH